MWKSESTPEFSHASSLENSTDQKDLLELNLSKHGKYATYFTPLSENTSPLHMTRVRPVWDNLCTKRGGCPFSHYNQFNQINSVKGISLHLWFPWYLNLIRLNKFKSVLKCNNPRLSSSLEIYLPQLKAVIFIDLQVLFLFWHWYTSMYQRS